MGLALRSVSPDNSGALSYTAASGNAASAGSVAAAGSNLEAVAANGQITDAVSSGAAQISQFLSAPNGDVYVLFAGRVDLSNTMDAFDQATGCLLAKVSPDTGDPTCIDNTLASVNWPASGAGSDPSAPIQFDSRGAIYYTGTTNNGMAALRKYLNGVTTNLITDNVSIDHFLVMRDGSVFVSGSTTSTGATWTRRISPSGALESLEPLNSNFLALFPDNNVYMGLWNNGHFGVARYLTTSDQVEAKYWIGYSGWGEDDYFDGGTICSAANQAGQNPFCGFYGSYISWSFATDDGNEFVTAGGGGLGAVAMQYYPTVRFLPTEVADVTVAEGVNNDLVLGGLNSDGQNVLTLYNTSNDTEVQLLGPDNEIEIYHLHYSARQNKLFFDGLRFSDNQYVIGEIAMPSHQLAILDSGSTKWSDLQPLG